MSENNPGGLPNSSDFTVNEKDNANHGCSNYLNLSIVFDRCVFHMRADKCHGIEIYNGKLFMVYFMRPPDLKAFALLGPLDLEAISPLRPPAP